MPISANGGTRPIWAPDGKRVYFWENSRMMSATIARDPAPRVVSRDALFDGRYERDFDVARDGRFLMIESGSSGVSLVVVPNWATELRRLTGARRPSDSRRASRSPTLRVSAYVRRKASTPALVKESCISRWLPTC